MDTVAPGVPFQPKEQENAYVSVCLCMTACVSGCMPV